MENYRTIVALAKIKEYRINDEYEEAYEIVRELDFKHVSRITDFSMIADVCTQLGDFETARRAYECINKKNESRHSLGELVYLNIKLKDADAAKELLKRYEKLAPQDPARLVYRYRIQKLEKDPIEQRIATLEQLKEEDYNERWGAELCKLYHQQGRDDLCIAECDCLIRWFGEGEYIDWAKTLKAHLQGEIDVTEMSERTAGQQTESPQQDEYEVDITEDVVTEFEAVEGTTEYAEDEFGAAVEDPGYFETDETDVTEFTEPELTGDYPEQTESVEENAEDYPEQTEFAEESVEDYPEQTESDDAFSVDGYNDVTEFGSPVIESPDRADFEIEAVQYMSEYLEKNSSPYVRLRINRKEVPVIAGQLGKQLANGTAVLEDFFGNYARMEIVRKQLIRSLDMIFDPLKRGANIIITGGPKSGKTTLAKKLAKVMSRFGVLRSSKALLVDASRMNKIDLVKQRESLADCTIIIENAGELATDTIENLLALSSAYADRTAIILEDDRKAINALLRDYPELNSVYNNRIHLPSEYKAADLKGFVFEYLVSQEYDLELAADAVIDERLEAILAGNPADPISASVDMVKKAIVNAEKRNSKVLADIALDGRYANVDIMTIRAEDFR